MGVESILAPFVQQAELITVNAINVAATTEQAPSLCSGGGMLGVRTAE